jgi:2-methylcitrate dehydratase PrpD
MSVTLELVRNILDTSFENFDASLVEKARERIIDVVGCIIGGANAPGCSMLLDLVREWGGREEATIIVHGGKVPAHNAALVNSIMARSYDFEPCGSQVNGKTTPAHISGTTVPVALAVGETRGTSGKDLLTALILGDDLTSRIIAASNINLDSGFEPTGIANMFGATVIAGRLLRLNEHQMLNALGIALNQVAGTFQNIFDGVHSFKLPQGLAARGGIFSAALARKGFTAVKDALFSKYGYFSLYCKTFDADFLTKDLGTKFYANNTFKAYPCCRSTHAAIDCSLALVGDTAIDPEEIEEVIIDVAAIGHDFAVGQPFEIGEVPQASASFSLRYTVADALLRKEVRPEHFMEEYIRDEKVLNLIGKIRLTATVPPETPLAAGVKVRMRNGDEHEKHVDMPKGNEVFTPLTPTEKKDKFFANVAFSGTVPLEKAKKAAGLMESIEKIDNVTEIIRLLVPLSSSGKEPCFQA